jgi:hypothetical protein
MGVVVTETIAGVSLPEITDGFMRENLSRAKPFTIVLLKKTARISDPDAPAVIWEHGRRNFSLREAGLMPIVCPVRDGSDLAGMCIFTTAADEAARIMSGDPGVKAGLFTYEVHETRSFPGSSLPKG